MALFAGIRRVLRRKKTLSNISMEELMRSRKTLESEEQTILLDVSKLEKEKERLLLRGADDPSKANRAVTARRFKAKDTEIKHAQTNLGLLANQHRVLSGVIQVKRQEAFLRKIGLASVVGKLDMDELKRYIEDATVENVFQMERFVDIVQCLDHQAQIAEQSDDDELREIEAAMTKIAEMKDSVERDQVARDEAETLTRRLREHEVEALAAVGAVEAAGA